MNCRNSGLPQTMAAPSCSCGGIPSDISGPGPVMRPFSTESCFDGDNSRFPVGMGYVPVQMWEATYPLARGFVSGTIFPSLDYPFSIGRCRR